MAGKTRREAGIALAAALLALVLLGALAAASGLLALRDRRLAGQMQALDRAKLAADRGAYEAVVRWDRELNHLPPGDSLGFGGLGGQGSGYAGSVTRLSDRLFMVRSEGSVPRWGARSEVLLLAGVDPPRPGVAAALTSVAGSVAVGPRADISGMDRPFDTGPCGLPVEPVAGVRVLEPSALTLACPDTACVSGAPPVLVDGAMAPEDALPFGLEWDELVALADVRLPPGSWRLAAAEAEGRCDRTVVSNWGAPGSDGPCGWYRPVIHATGPVTLLGGAGQGVLLMDGPLLVTGGVRFDGVVVARGPISSSGSGGRILGGVLLAAPPGVWSRLDGFIRIHYSGCALGAAAGALAAGTPLARRSWVQRF